MLIPADLAEAPLDALLDRAEAVALAARGGIVTYSRKVFIPLTRLCRDVCHYCTFATAPRHVGAPYLAIDEAVAIARAGAAAGCKEALFTLGDQPERRYPAARAALDAMGFATTLAYLGAVAAAVHAETGLLPHLNPGVMDAAGIAALRPHAASMGIMLETAADRLGQRGGPHFGSPDKAPAVRLATLEALGRQAVPTTTGLLIGIGETRAETIAALAAIRDLHARHGHIQEVIVQNFRAKPGTRMAAAPEPPLDAHLWAIAAARLVLPPGIRIQAPPNLRPGVLAQLLRAGVDDWGGVSPVTPDHVNPEAPWPELARLERETAAAGRRLVERLAIGPDHARDRRAGPCPPRRLACRHGAGAPGPRHPPALRPPDPGRRPRAGHGGGGRAAGRGADRHALFRRRAGICGDHPRRRPQAREHRGRGGHLRRQPQHQLHQHLRLSLHLLRFLQGQQPERARPGLPARPRGDRAPRGGGAGDGRDRGLPAGRHPPRL